MQVRAEGGRREAANLEIVEMFLVFLFSLLIPDIHPNALQYATIDQVARDIAA